MLSLQALNPKQPLVIAHRGDSKHAPENTMAAFTKALEVGAPMIETDLVLSSDKEIMLFHDEQLHRTTNGKGRPKDFNAKELQSLDAGSWFGPEFKGEKIPTLRQLLEFAQGKILLNLEIKPEAYEPGEPVDSIAKKTVALVHEMNLRPQVLISSFEPLVLLEAALLPHCPALALLIEGPIEQSHINFCSKIKAFSLNCPPDINEAQLNKACKAGLQVFCYTVNNPKQMHSLYHLGVSGVFSDDPAKMLHSLGL